MERRLFFFPLILSLACSLASVHGHGRGREGGGGRSSNKLDPRRLLRSRGGSSTAGLICLDRRRERSRGKERILTPTFFWLKSTVGLGCKEEKNPCFDSPSRLLLLINLRGHPLTRSRSNLHSSDKAMEGEGEEGFVMS